MPFDLTLPDGTILQNIPDGTTKAQIDAKLGLAQPTGLKNDFTQSGAELANAINAKFAALLTGNNDIIFKILSTSLAALGFCVLKSP